MSTIKEYKKLLNRVLKEQNSKPRVLQFKKSPTIIPIVLELLEEKFTGSSVSKEYISRLDYIKLTNAPRTSSF